MIDRGREGTPSNREFLFITAAPFVQKERTKPNVCQSDRTIYVFAYCTLDLIFRLLVKLWKFFFVMVFVHVDGIDHLTRVWSSRGIQPQFEVFHRFSSPFRKILSVPECLRSWCEYNNFVYTERSNGKIMKLRWNTLLRCDWRSLKMYILM